MRLELSLSVLLSAGVVTHAQVPTLRQLAIEHRGQIARSEQGCGWSGPPLAGIVSRADLAIEGTVVSRRTYSTADDRDILTEFEVATKQVIFQRRVHISSTPGPPLPIVFKTRGGTVVFDGYPFTLRVDDQRAHLNVGDHVVLFGQYDTSDGKWLFGSREFFHVSESVVLNTLPPFPEFPEGLQPRMPIQAFADKIRQLVAP